MNTVYKFCGTQGITILQNLELKVTPPNEFNDPFEFTPKMVCSAPLGYMTREDVCRWLYQTASCKGFSGSFDEFKIQYLKRLEDNASKTKQAMAETMEGSLPFVEQEFLDEVSKRFGILCMSGRRNSILMWGHYCDRALGLIIGFDKSSEMFHQEKGLKAVDYVKERVVFDSCWEDGSPEMAKYEEQVIFSKSLDWDYEREFRQIISLSSPLLIKKPLKCKVHTPGYFLPFLPEAIVSVTLGPRCPPELADEVRTLLQRPGFSRVKLDRAVLHKDDFTLEFE